VGTRLKFTMRTDKPETSIEALRRKLRAIVEIFHDPAATEHEKENAGALKERLEAQLRQAGAPKGDWSDVMFRLGRTARQFGKSTSPDGPSGDWSDNAFRLGRTIRRALKKWPRS
jgi:uncharacterized protein (DUF2461 family)